MPASNEYTKDLFERIQDYQAISSVTLKDHETLSWNLKGSSRFEPLKTLVFRLNDPDASR